MVHADPARLVQVFVNLLNNAAKYSPPETRISVTVRSTVARNGSVKDEGEGLDADFLSRVFDPFTRDNGQRTLARWLGVGLR
jgi:signal transduction histidine kinase